MRYKSTQCWVNVDGVITKNAPTFDNAIKFDSMFEAKVYCSLLHEFQASQDWAITIQYPISLYSTNTLELADRYEDHDLYTLAFNKKEYKVKNFDTNNWDKRNPTEVEKWVLDLYQRKGNAEPAQISGVLATAEISPISIKKAMAKKSDDDVVFANDFAIACKGETPPQWLSEPEKVFTIVGSQGYRKGGSASSWTPELAEEKLKWLESLDSARLEALKEKTSIYPKDILLAILRG